MLELERFQDDELAGPRDARPLDELQDEDRPSTELEVDQDDAAQDEISRPSSSARTTSPRTRTSSRSTATRTTRTTPPAPELEQLQDEGRPLFPVIA